MRWKNEADEKDAETVTQLMILEIVLETCHEDVPWHSM